jgi:hypothetical protein
MRHQAGSLTIVTEVPLSIIPAPAGKLISAVARANETKSEDPPHFSGCAKSIPFSSVRSVAGR